MADINLSSLPPELQTFVRYLENNEWSWVDESEQQDGSVIRLLPNEQDQPEQVQQESQRIYK